MGTSKDGTDEVDRHVTRSGVRREAQSRFVSP